MLDVKVEGPRALTVWPGKRNGATVSRAAVRPRRLARVPAVRRTRQTCVTDTRVAG